MLGILKLAVAMVLLYQPEDPTSVATIVFVRSELKGLSLHWQLLDAKYKDGWFRSRDDNPRELKIVRYRYCRLNGAPPAEYAVFFQIDWKEIQVGLEANADYLSHLSAVESVYPNNPYIPKLREDALKLYQVWSMLTVVKSPQQEIDDVRFGLLRLRDLLGEDDFYQGRIPPSVPLRWYKEVRP
jgi:hypothetical protein